MERTGTKVKKNFISSIISQVVLIGLGFLIPRLYLENYGSDVNGVLSTIKQIFIYLFLLEAGVGLASTQALYKKLGKNDYDGANAVLAATHKYYVKTGIVYLAIVLAIAVGYAYLIPTPIDSGTVFLIIILTAIPALFSYFVQAKYRILIEAEGSRYVLSNAETALQIVSNAAKLLVLIFSNNIVFIQLSYCIIYLGQLIFLYFYAKRKYKWLNLKVKPDYKAISEKNSVLVHQLSGMVFNNTDVILISMLCDFASASVYTIYNMFFAQVQNFITQVASSVTSALGIMYNADKKEFDKLYDVYEIFYIMANYVIYTLMAVFLLPLVQIYTTGINDADYNNSWLILLFVVMNLMSCSKTPSNIAIEFAQHFKKTRIYAIWEMVINVSASIIAIYFMGICGALVGTIIALVYRCVMTIRYSNKEVLNRSQWTTYKTVLVNALVFALVMVIFFVDTFSNYSFLHLLLNGVLNSIWIVGLFLLVNYLFNKSAFKIVIELLRSKKKS